MTGPAGGPAARRAVSARAITTAALLAALLAASSLLVVRIGPVPLTLQVMVVVLAALLLTPVQALLAVGSYLVMGAVGLPVFSGGTGGIGVLAGPTGGYLWGFLAGAAAGSLVRQLLERGKSRTLLADAVAAAVVIVVAYACGALQLGLVSHLSPGQALSAGVAPFIGPDVVKAIVAVVIARAVRRAIPGR